MRECSEEIKFRVEFIKKCIKEAGASGVVFGNSGGKDSALVGALCKMACDNTVGIIMPCGSARGYGLDRRDALEVAEKFGIETLTVDVSPIKDAMKKSLDGACDLTDGASANINPRLRMSVLYAVAASKNLLVAGTGNKSEIYMGYFTKWGDGGCDFNPIADLCVGEVYELLRFIGAPACVIDKAPSAALYDGQTDESDMGVSYAEIDSYIAGGDCSDEAKKIIGRYHFCSAHKRAFPATPTGNGYET